MSKGIWVGIGIGAVVAAISGNIYMSGLLEDQADALITKTRDNLPEGVTLQTGDISASAWRGEVVIDDIVFNGVDDGKTSVEAGSFAIMSSMSALLNKEGPEAVAFRDLVVEKDDALIKAREISASNQSVLKAIILGEAEDLTPADIKGAVKFDAVDLSVTEAGERQVTVGEVRTHGSLERGTLDLSLIKDLKITNDERNQTVELASYEIRNLNISGIARMMEAIEELDEKAADIAPEMRALLDNWKNQPEATGKHSFRFDGLNITQGDGKNGMLASAGYDFDYDTNILSDLFVRDFRVEETDKTVSLDEVYLERLDLTLYAALMEAIPGIAAEVKSSGQPDPSKMSQMIADQIFSDNIVDLMLDGMGFMEFRLVGLDVQSHDGQPSFSVDQIRLGDVVRKDGLMVAANMDIDDLRAGPLPAIAAEQLGFKDLHLDISGKSTLDDDVQNSVMTVELTDGFKLDMKSTALIRDIPAYKEAYKDYLRASLNFPNEEELANNPMVGVSQAIRQYAKLPVGEDLEVDLVLADQGLIGMHVEQQAAAMNSTRDDFAQVIAFQAAMMLPMQLEPEEVAHVKDSLQALLMSDSKPFSVRITLDDDWREKLEALADSNDYANFKVSQILNIGPAD